jgi:NitT/TauT family transport system substrate-binding protein
MLGLGTAKAEDTIRILCPTWSGYAPLFVANELGYYKKLGLHVTVKFDDEKADVMAAMARKDIEMELRTVDDYVSRPRTASTPGIIIGTIDESRGGDAVVAGGGVTDVAQLKGKAVAADTSAPALLLLQIELKKKGLTLKDLMLKSINVPDSVTVFADSSITAITTYQPFLSQLMKVDSARKPKMLLSSADFPHYITDVFIARNDDLKAHPLAYRHFLQATYQAIDEFKKDRATFLKVAAPHFGLSPADFAASIDGNLIYTDEPLAKSLMGTPSAPGTLFGVFNTIMQLELENGRAEAKLSATSAIDPATVAALPMSTASAVP